MDSEEKKYKKDNTSAVKNPLSLVINIFTISYQVVSSAMANPVWRLGME
ncbi:MAG TPA: hypothetical protein VKR53_18170 [Puia sp.]|nr:hypothetical protein [Puia sp.]